MSQAPKRKPRWFRWSLRTLFVVVTVFACWVGYSLKWIRQRRSFLAEQRALHSDDPEPHLPVSWLPQRFSRLPTAPQLLGLFGEEGVYRLHMNVPFERSHVEGQKYSQAEIDEMERWAVAALRLFPEAEEVVYGPVWNTKPVTDRPLR